MYKMHVIAYKCFFNTWIIYCLEPNNVDTDNIVSFSVHYFPILPCLYGYIWRKMLFCDYQGHWAHQE